ncbi:MAG: S66 peptidase family protein [Lachnospiraceae bacterium]
MIFPDNLKQGDTIGVTACSAGNAEVVDLLRADSAAGQLTVRGFRVKETPNVRTDKEGRSSSAKERARQLHSLVTDEQVRMILLAKGGDYLAEMLPYVDYEEIARHPKWYQGYSDPTGLLFSITTKCDMATVYGTNYGDFGMRPWHECLENNIELLEGKRSTQNNFAIYQDGFLKKTTGYEPYQTTQPVKLQSVRGEEKLHMEGRLLGGCLDVLIDLVGTPYENVKGYIEKYCKDGILWYLESFALSRERLPIALWHLREAGWFEHASGFIFGRPAFFDNSTETTYEEAVLEALGCLNVPIVTGADIGHKPPYMTVINGAYGVLDYEKTTLRLQMRKEK